MIQVILALQAWSAFLVTGIPIILRRHRAKTDAALEDRLKSMELAVQYAFLTPEERQQLLGREMPKLLARPPAVETESWDVEECKAGHRWSALRYDTPRRTQWDHVICDEDGKAYIKKCLDCGHRSARSITQHKKSGSTETDYLWFSD